MITVATFSTLIEAHIALGRLEAEGIEAHLMDAGMGDYGMPSSIATGGIKLQVQEEDADRAKAILASDYSDDLEALPPE